MLALFAVALLPALVPAPRSVAALACRTPLSPAALRFAPPADRGGVELLQERWRALGIATRGIAGPVRVRFTTLGAHEPERYRLVVDGRGVTIAADDAEAQFDALATLAQLPEHGASGWILPCVRVDDAPALRWRIVSDDVSRGPFPTMTYAKARIRGLAALKINGWSPYMEQVVVDPRAPFVAFPNGWTAAQLHTLRDYAARFHVALIPEQQTFAHLHETLKWERFAPLAELPHGWLISESDPATYAYLDGLLREVVAATRPTPFIHLGADEPIDLGRGRTPRTAQAFADHVKRVEAAIAGSGARPMIWDDAIQKDRSILPLLPRRTVIVAFHYGVESTYAPYLRTITQAGFAAMAAPGAANWDEIYPDLSTAYANAGRFVDDARKVPGTLGMFDTVWHDDGESLFGATWAPVAFAAASAWQSRAVDLATWHATFARAFFGTADPRYARDLDDLEAIRDALRAPGEHDPSDVLFWWDPFDAAQAKRVAALDVGAVRRRAEEVLTDLWSASPPLNAHAAAVMRLAALRYDALGRRLQIGVEAPADYADARAEQSADPNRAERDLNFAKYLCWELRDELTAIAPIYAAAWRAESTEPGLDRVLVRYRAAEERAQRRADAIDATERLALPTATLPAWPELVKSP